MGKSKGIPSRDIEIIEVGFAFSNKIFFIYAHDRNRTFENMFKESVYLSTMSHLVVVGKLFLLIEYIVPVL